MRNVADAVPYGDVGFVDIFIYKFDFLVSRNFVLDKPG